MSKPPLIDKYGRQLTYLRLSVTDRCNFRCYYCMPEEGMDFAARQELLSFDELYSLSALFCSLGVNKIRITGGEPFVRAGIIPFLRRLSKIPGLEEITVTSNGSLTSAQIKALQEIGIRKINISLDSLDRDRFFQITRRDRFEDVYASIFQLLNSGFEVKLNCVVAENKNIQDILPFVELTKDYPLAVRFLEEMPFNGSDTFLLPQWSHREIYQHIQSQYSLLEKLQSEPTSTSVNYRVPGYKGTFGVIPSFSRTFCGTCNRIRLGATGELRTCLYGPPALNLRDLVRQGAKIEQLENELRIAVSNREKDGFAAEASVPQTTHASMSVLGG
ncbi:GTP 3',8-cyclase MoaA [Rufibacter hautae]|uniref:GTP 3',8-cyclase n=1 Tax=Rufibacter hautae TaxID=2595005 RepID=A0A5B6TG00_9BACT|nr:GTP 3',8-cyclase MoaA [Rufibacter hautae]KAA3438225.1 GTP 3',8-cyclase MoaA [Rufibacter hautae]